MKYQGSKNRLAKHILPIMLGHRRGRPWVEPFVGGANMIDKVEGERIGYDLNADAIKALTLIRDSADEIPNTNNDFTESDYKSIPRGLAEKTDLQAFAAFAYSFGGKHLGGWARGNKGNGEPRDYVNEAKRNAIKQSPLLKGAVFKNAAYQEIQLDKSSLIYCDPPYKDTTKYKTGGFNHDHFWEWCQKMANKGHVVFVSEYVAPEFAKVVWEKEVSSSLTKDTGSKRAVEKLFIVEPSE